MSFVNKVGKFVNKVRKFPFKRPVTPLSKYHHYVSKKLFAKQVSNL